MAFLYLPYTVQPHKDGVCLFERDVELRITYSLPDGPRGPVDWDVSEVHFDDGNATAVIHRHEPLFHVMYNALDVEWLDEAVRETLANDGIVDLYAVPYHAL